MKIMYANLTLRGLVDKKFETFFKLFDENDKGFERRKNYSYSSNNLGYFRVDKNTNDKMHY